MKLIADAILFLKENGLGGWLNGYLRDGFTLTKYTNESFGIRLILSYVGNSVVLTRQFYLPSYDEFTSYGSFLRMVGVSHAILLRIKGLDLMVAKLG